jgi:hypothetical protein
MAGSTGVDSTSRDRFCGSCEAQLPFAARFCPSCGLRVKAAGHDPVAFMGDGGPGANPETAAEREARTLGRAQRQGSPQWLAVVGALCVVLMAWLLFRSPPVDNGAAVDDSADTELVDDSSIPSDDGTSAVDGPEGENAATNVSPAIGQTDDGTNLGAGEASEDSVESSTATERVTESAPTVAATPVDLGPADVGDLNADGWSIIIGDGHHVEVVDLGNGERRRHNDVGAPVATLDSRLLLYQPPELMAVPIADPAGPADLIARVPTLQEMYTRARSVKSPVSADNGRSIWWPNNNSNPQTWIKIDLVSGDVLDEMSLSSRVFGGPEIVSTLGSGTFERIDGRWEFLGDLFASSASPDEVLGQRCVSPNNCRWVILDRRTGQSRSVDIDVDGPFDATLISAADRPLVLLSDRILDLEADRSIPLVLANPLEVVTTNKADLLAVAHGVPSGVTRASVTVHNLATEAEIRIELSAMRPDWLLLVRR